MTKKIIVPNDYGWPLFAMALAISLVGVVAICSASIEYSAVNFNNPFHHVTRHIIYCVISLTAALCVSRVPMQFWFKLSPILFFLAIILLVLVLIPGIGKEVKGSKRWIDLGIITLQCSEFAKLGVILYIAGYLVRRMDEVREQFSGFIKPMAVLFIVVLLLMMEPDYGATVVATGTVFGMLFLAGSRVIQFIGVGLAALVALAFVAVQDEYRIARLTAFTDPFSEANRFEGGYQLASSLMAFGNGGWFGQGLGHSVMKLLYLPEAHTDFVFAIFAEEFGVLGCTVLIAMFVTFIALMMKIARQAEAQALYFNAFTVYGLLIMLSGQIFINIGVVSGLLPTKGLTLPFISYGGSSLIVCSIAVAIAWRVNYESVNMKPVKKTRKRKASTKTKAVAHA